MGDQKSKDDSKKNVPWNGGDALALSDSLPPRRNPNPPPPMAHRPPPDDKNK